MINKPVVLITGGAGFIGSALIRYLLSEGLARVVNVDKLTYAGNLSSLSSISSNSEYSFERQDIVDRKTMRRVFSQYQPDLVMHLAAESHVDRSIDNAAEFIQTNIVGTYNLLETALEYWRNLSADKKNQFRFHHISTDEVYGSLGESGLFTETTAYDPSSPYSATKASSDHLVRAWQRTFGLPILVSNCSNNYGPYQFPEKLIPHMIVCALAGKPLPVYGKGSNVRDWLHVEDHVQALWRVLTHGKVGETYNIGGNSERSNLTVVTSLCQILDDLLPNSSSRPHQQLISYVQDRPGHDLRYAIDATKIKNELSWEPKYSFETGLKHTVNWYLQNQDWWQNIINGSYRHKRLGLGV